VCGQRRWLDVVSLRPTPCANGYLDPDAPLDQEVRYPLDVVVCQNCWLMSLRQVVDPEVLYRNYSYVCSNSATITRHLRRLVRTCVDYSGLTPGELVVEIGSNTGDHLRSFAERGMRTLGVDPARDLAVAARAKGVPTVAEFFTAHTAAAVRRTHGRARLILGRHVFAHIDDLGDVLAGVRTLLDPDGVFLIEVPYLAELIANCQFDTIYHEHLSYFSVHTLDRLFERHGMRMLNVARADVHGGSILVFAGVAESTRPVDPSVAMLLDREKRMGLTGPRVFREFATRVEQVTGSVRDLVRELATEGNRIAGYGAPAKGNSLLNACGLGRDEVEFCSDTTELKQGKLLPGSHVPVRSPDEAARHPPDYYLLLAWNYAPEIIGRERRFLDDGGRFIVPIPEPVVVDADSAAHHISAAGAATP
jgi:SAM-dependent methyltransferase